MRTTDNPMDDRCEMRLERCQEDLKMRPESGRSWDMFIGCMERIERCADRKARYYLQMNLDSARKALREWREEQNMWEKASATSAHVTVALLLTSFAAAILARH